MIPRKTVTFLEQHGERVVQVFTDRIEGEAGSACAWAEPAASTPSSVQPAGGEVV
jgi:hypothetical protein